MKSKIQQCGISIDFLIFIPEANEKHQTIQNLHVN